MSQACRSWEWCGDRVAFGTDITQCRMVQQGMIRVWGRHLDSSSTTSDEYDDDDVWTPLNTWDYLHLGALVFDSKPGPDSMPLETMPSLVYACLTLTFFEILPLRTDCCLGRIDGILPSAGTRSRHPSVGMPKVAPVHP